ncbi:bifunctional DNA primase/polymerase [Nocardiopsis dassonvillei]|uniref:bifunctional DNA primase/polymerase n=1 Tax=Nocardiopsis dassonvillei TaxID=2014 RepID=UPI0033C18A49
MTDTRTRASAAAEELVEQRGWAVMPLAGKGPVRNCQACRRDSAHHGADCDCGRPWCHGFYSASTDVDFLDRHWPHDADGVGIATGASGLVVVDVDGESGHAWVTGLARRGVLTPTLMMRSSSGTGYHLFYRGHMRSRPLRLAPTHPRAGTADDIPVDIKAEGSYVRWTGIVATDRPIVDVPEGLGDVLDERQQRLDAAHAAVTSSASVRPAGPGRCVHSPGYLDRGVQMAVDRIGQIDLSGGGVHSQVYGALRGIIRRHAETCGRDCVSETQLDALFAAARQVGERDGDCRKAWDNALKESGLEPRFGTRTSR